MRKSNFHHDNRGISTIEVILLLVVFVGIVVIFREKITALINTVFDDLYAQLVEF